MIKYITVNRGTIDSNRKRGTNKPAIRVSWGKYGKVRYAHAVIVFGPSTFKYEPNNPMPHGARLWVETKAAVGLRINRKGCIHVCGKKYNHKGRCRCGSCNLDLGLRPVDRDGPISCGGFNR